MSHWTFIDSCVYVYHGSVCILVEVCLVLQILAPQKMGNMWKLNVDVDVFFGSSKMMKLSRPMLAEISFEVCFTCQNFAAIFMLFFAGTKL